MIPGIGEFHNAVDRSKSSHGPEVDRNTLDDLLGECLDPGDKSVLFMHGEMHGDLQTQEKRAGDVRKRDDLIKRRERSLPFIGFPYLSFGGSLLLPPFRHGKRDLPLGLQ